SRSGKTWRFESGGGVGQFARVAALVLDAQFVEHKSSLRSASGAMAGEFRPAQRLQAKANCIFQVLFDRDAIGVFALLRLLVRLDNLAVIHRELCARGGGHFFWSERRPVGLRGDGVADVLFPFCGQLRSWSL